MIYTYLSEMKIVHIISHLSTSHLTISFVSSWVGSQWCQAWYTFGYTFLNARVCGLNYESRNVVICKWNSPSLPSGSTDEWTIICQCKWSRNSEGITGCLLVSSPTDRIWHAFISILYGLCKLLLMCWKEHLACLKAILTLHSIHLECSARRGYPKRCGSSSRKDLFCELFQYIPLVWKWYISGQNANLCYLPSTHIDVEQ